MFWRKGETEPAVSARGRGGKGKGDRAGSSAARTYRRDPSLAGDKRCLNAPPRGRIIPPPRCANPRYDLGTGSFPAAVGIHRRPSGLPPVTSDPSPPAPPPPSTNQITSFRPLVLTRYVWRTRRMKAGGSVWRRASESSAAESVGFMRSDQQLHNICIFTPSGHSVYVRLVFTRPNLIRLFYRRIEKKYTMSQTHLSTVSLLFLFFQFAHLSD